MTFTKQLKPRPSWIFPALALMLFVGLVFMGSTGEASNQEPQPAISRKGRAAHQAVSRRLNARHTADARRAAEVRSFDDTTEATDAIDPLQIPHSTFRSDSSLLAFGQRRIRFDQGRTGATPAAATEGSSFRQASESESEDDLDGPEVIEARVADYLRRRGLQDGSDPNQRLQLTLQEYEQAEVEKTNRLLRPNLNGTNWVSLGPTNGAGRMSAIAAHPSVAGTVYAGAAGGGVWKTTDGGSSWLCLTDSINNLFVGALALAPSSPNIVYLGTGEGDTSTPGIGLLKSTDGGSTWQFPSSVIATSFFVISVHPTNPQELVIGTSDGAFRSTDGGAHWTMVLGGGLTSVPAIVRHPTDAQVLFATTQYPTEIVKSTDGGATWSAKSNGVPTQSLGRMAIAISPSNPLVLYAAAATGDNLGHVYKTIDGGETWSLKTTNGYLGNSWYNNTVVVSPADANIVIAGASSYIRSSDGGATWWPTLFAVHVDAHDLEYQGATLYIANDGGIYTSTDEGQDAQVRNTGLVTRQYYTVASDPNNRNQIYGGTQDNGTSRRPDSGSTDWTDIIGGDGFDCVVNPYVPDMFYGTAQLGSIFRRPTNGDPGDFFEEVEPDYAVHEFAPFATVLVMDPKHSSVLYTGSYRVWKSTDGGDSWAPLPTTTTDGSAWPTSELRRIAIAKADPNMLLVAKDNSVFRSTNGGSSWTSSEIPPSCCNRSTINGLEIDPRNPSIAYAAMSFFPGDDDNHVYMSTDGGLTWAPRGLGLPHFAAFVVRVDPTDSDILFCGTDVGVYSSNNKGLSWTRFGTGLPSVSVFDLRIMEDGSALRAATFGRGVWELQIPPIVNNPPSAIISSPASGGTVISGAVDFQGMTSDPDSGDSVTGAWYFSDTGEVVTTAGGPSTVTHVFNQGGVFKVSLTAKDTHGARANVVRTITVLEVNDNCTTPTVIPNRSFPWTRTLNKVSATNQASDPAIPDACSSSPVSHTYWFEFTPAVSTTYQFSMRSTGYLDVMSIWQGPTCGPYTVVPSGCSIYELTLFGSAGVTWRIMVSTTVNDYSINTFSVNTLTPLAELRFSAASYSVSEAGYATIPITRTGDSSSAASVDVTTIDGTAKQNRDYTIGSTRLNFAPGETTKNFFVLVSDNAYVDGNRTLSIKLSNSTNAFLNTPDTATLTIVDNDSGPATSNPLDNADARFFVRQHYYDFLSRLPDIDGMEFWVSQITQCGANQGCLNKKRLDVSNAFFAELEYQQTAAYVLRLYRAAYGNNQPFPNPDNSNAIEARKLPGYAMFSLDRARLIGSANLAQDQLTLANVFAERPEFLSKYPGSLTGPQFVGALLANINSDNGADLTALSQALIAEYNQGGAGRVLYRLADDNLQTNPINNRPFIDAEYNRAFVASQYFGYLRRDSDMGGFLFWLDQVNGALPRDIQKQHAMVCSFITSLEYQQRFSPVVTHTNAECPQ